MAFFPADLKTLWNFACPSLSLTLPMVVVPFLNVTVPVGVPLYFGTTVAVKVTHCPTFEGFTDETRVVVLVAWFTTCFSAGESLATKFVSPE